MPWKWWIRTATRAALRAARSHCSWKSSQMKMTISTDFQLRSLFLAPKSYVTLKESTDINSVPSCIFPDCWIKCFLLNVSQSVRQQGQPPCQPSCTRAWYQDGLPWVCWHWRNFPGLNFGPMLHTWKHCHRWVDWVAFHDSSWDSELLWHGGRDQQGQ